MYYPTMQVSPFKTSFLSYIFNKATKWQVFIWVFHTSSVLVKTSLFSPSPHLPTYNFLLSEGTFFFFCQYGSMGLKGQSSGKDCLSGSWEAQALSQHHAAFCIVMAHDFARLSKSKMYNPRKATRQLWCWARAAGFSKGGTEGVDQAQRGQLFMGA